MIRFGSLAWGGATLAVLLGCYTVSLKASSERKAADQLRLQIAADLRGIRMLEAEYRTRSRPAEQQRWNDEAFGLQAASSGQLVSDPLELASFEAKPAGPVAPRYAVAVAPAATPAPVRTVAYTPAARPLDPVGDLVAAADPRADLRQVSLQVAR